MIGGVIAHHPYLKVLLNEKFDKNIQIIDVPQHVVSHGAALIAQKQWLKLYKENKTLELKEQ